MRVSINKSRNCDQSVDFESSESTSSQLFVSSELMYRVYRVNFLYWIKQFAIFIGGLQTFSTDGLYDWLCIFSNP